MGYLNISLVGAVAIFGAAIGIQQSQPLSINEQADMTGFSTLIELQSARDLPVQDFDDRSLVFPRAVAN